MPTISTLEKPCPRGHTDVKRSAKGVRRCPDCRREAQRERRLHPETQARERAYREGRRDVFRARSRAWREANLSQARESSRAYMHRRRLREDFGLTVEEYDGLVQAQGGVCGICKQPPQGRVLVVDHDHETGAIRGLLCTACNVGIGNLGDSAERLRAALAWLEGGGRGAYD